ncbi:MAG: hypothetical protein KGD73_11240 [Candidatus Lokiarchaeota archaeon]|nr:hypothetical protein [Candidatus Lokiarchaeota archaeon]
MIEIVFWITIFFASYLLIYFSADFFLDNLKELCLILQLSPFVIGLLVLGIDLEESIASIIAAVNGLPIIAVGNVMGNSIISLTLCFALPALLQDIDLKSISSFYFIILYSCLGAILFSFLISFGLFIFGIITLILYAVYVFNSLKVLSKKKKIDLIDMNEVTEEIKGWSTDTNPHLKLKKIFFIILGFCLILLGGEFLIISAENIIMLTGLNEAFFGFIIIAFVTNVEELTLVFKSIKKKSVEIGLGGMIGKLIWNLSFTYGISGIIAVVIDISVILIINWLFLLCLILFYQVKSKTHSLNRTDGVILLVFFIVFIITNILTTI